MTYHIYPYTTEEGTQNTRERILIRACIPLTIDEDGDKERMDAFIDDLIEARENAWGSR